MKRHCELTLLLLPFKSYKGDFQGKGNWRKGVSYYDCEGFTWLFRNVQLNFPNWGFRAITLLPGWDGFSNKNQRLVVESSWERTFQRNCNKISFVVGFPWDMFILSVDTCEQLMVGTCMLNFQMPQNVALFGKSQKEQQRKGNQFVQYFHCDVASFFPW